MSIPKSYNTTITILLAISCFACSPGQIVSDGETGFEEDPTFCIDSANSAVSCWIPWNGTFAEVWPECLASDAVKAKLFDGPTLTEIPGWGNLECYSVIGTDTDVCFVRPWGVLLSYDGDEWAPSFNELAGDLTEVPPPC